MPLQGPQLGSLRSPLGLARLKGLLRLGNRVWDGENVAGLSNLNDALTDLFSKDISADGNRTVPAVKCGGLQRI